MLIAYTLGGKNFQYLVQLASEVMNRGGMIIYPTDTVYGLGVGSTNLADVEKIFWLKGRSAGRAMSSIYQSIEQIEQFCSLTDSQHKVVHRYLPGLYTFLLKPISNTRLARPLIDRERGTVGVRIPNYPFTKALAEAFDKPYTCTSANVSGLPSPKTPEEVDQYLLKPNDLSLRGPRLRRGTKQSTGNILFIDAGVLAGIPSTVIDLTKTPPEVVRQGAGVFKM